MKRMIKHILLAVSTALALNVGAVQAAITGTVQYTDTVSVLTAPTTMTVGVQTASGLVVLYFTQSNGTSSAIPGIIDNAYRHGGTLTFEGFLPRIFEVTAGP